MRTMNNHLSNPLNNPINAPKPGAIYRPKYRVRTTNPSYELDSASVTLEREEAGIFQAIEALEEWNTEEQERGKKRNPCWHPDKLKLLSIYIAPPPQAAWTQIILRAARDW